MRIEALSGRQCAPSTSNQPGCTKKARAAKAFGLLGDGNVPSLHWLTNCKKRTETFLGDVQETETPATNHGRSLFHSGGKLCFAAAHHPWRCCESESWRRLRSASMKMRLRFSSKRRSRRGGAPSRRPQRPVLPRWQWSDSSLYFRCG